MTTAGALKDVRDLLSRSRPRTDNGIESRVIRLSQLRAEGGPAVAIMKVARDFRGAAELRTQRRLAAEVVSQPGLDKAWRELVPRVLAFDERAEATVCVESYRPGIRMADVLADHPHRFEELAAMALSAIAPLHQATARSIVVDNLSSVRQWVVDPIASLAAICDRRHPGLVPELERLEAMLTRAVVGRRMTVCWTHGGYSPGVVRMAGPQGPVNRIVAWDKARGDRPALVDVYLLLLTASAQVEGVDLGDVVGRRVTSGLSDSERTALSAVSAGAEPLDERVAILLAWLQHISVMSRTDADRSEHDGWLTANVTQVLDAVTDGCHVPHGPTATDAVQI